MPLANKQIKTSGSINKKGERIAKVIARAGICSRREAERWIGDGRVILDGKVLKTPAVNVTTASQILVDGTPLPAEAPTRLWRYHKPAGLLNTHKDPQGRPTLFENLPTSLPRLISVGRLDINSEGLLLITNDGELARRLELPSTDWPRQYRVRVRGYIEQEALAELENGINVGGIRFGPIKAILDRQLGANAWITLSLAEGKNREVRKVMEFLGWPVNRLIRVAYGPFRLGNLAKGALDEVKPKSLREQLGYETKQGNYGAHRRRQV